MRSSNFRLYHHHMGFIRFADVLYSRAFSFQQLKRPRHIRNAAGGVRIARFTRCSFASPAGASLPRLSSYYSGCMMAFSNPTRDFLIICLFVLILASKVHFINRRQPVASSPRDKHRRLFAAWRLGFQQQQRVLCRRRYHTPRLVWCWSGELRAHRGPEASNFHWGGI